jgi:hypothetical protein
LHFENYTDGGHSAGQTTAGNFVDRNGKYPALQVHNKFFGYFWKKNWKKKVFTVIFNRL